MYQKRELSLSYGGCRTARTNRRLGMIVTSFQDLTDFSDIFLFLENNALFYHFLVNLLAHNKKIVSRFCTPLEVSDIFLFLENNALFYHFLVNLLAHNKKIVSRFCTPLEVNFHIFGTSKHRKEKLLSNVCFATFTSTLWRFLSSKQIICLIHF